jgi:hypothetical protein
MTKTRLTAEQLKINAEALGFNPNDRGAPACAAMVSDPGFRERITRMFFERALAAVRAD